MIKKTLLALLILLVVVIGIFFISRYISYLNDDDPDKTFLLPHLELAQTEIYSLTAEKTEMNTRLIIKNQLPFAFTADSLDYKIFIDSVEVIKNRYKKTILLRALDSSHILLPLTVLNHDLISTLKTNERKRVDSIEYRIQASFYSNIPFRKKFDVDIKRRLPLFHLLEMKAEDIEIDSLNFSRASAKLRMAINNKNVFPVEVSNFTYEFSIENEKWIKGKIPGHIYLREGSTTQLYAPVKISFKEMSQTLKDLIREGSNVTYDLHVNFTLKTDNNMIYNSKVVLKSKGSVRSLVKLMKDS